MSEREGPYTDNVVPIEDASMRWFREALTKSSPLSPSAVRRIVHQCWRDIRNSAAPTHWRPLPTPPKEPTS